jgi:hypothetical protein
MKLIHFPSGEKLGLVAEPTRAMRETVTVRSAFLVGDGPWGKQRRELRTIRLERANGRRLMVGDSVE